MPSLINICVTNPIGLASRCRRKYRAVKSSSRVPCAPGKIILATLTRLRTHEQLMFHRDCNWMIGFCFVLLPRIQGDSLVANLLGSQAAARDAPPTRCQNRDAQ